MNDITGDPPATKRSRKMAREPQSEGSAARKPSPSAECQRPRAPTKTSMVVNLLSRADGATIDQLAAATGWLPHTTRAALTGLKKKGYVMANKKVEDRRIYHIASKPAVPGEATS